MDQAGVSKGTAEEPWSSRASRDGDSGGDLLHWVNDIFQDH